VPGGRPCRWRLVGRRTSAVSCPPRAARGVTGLAAAGSRCPAGLVRPGPRHARLRSRCVIEIPCRQRKIADSACMSAVPSGRGGNAQIVLIYAPRQSGLGSAQRRRWVVTEPASSALPCAWALSWPGMSLAAECALPGVPLALVAAALAGGHAGLQQWPGDGRVVVRLAAHHPEGGGADSGASRHSRMHLTISARSCSRKPRRRCRPGPPNSQDAVAQGSLSGAPFRRDRALRAPARTVAVCAAAASARGLAVAASAPADRQANVPRVGWIRGAAGSVGVFALPHGGGFTDHVSG
jgi:hypothetical protein